jgi:surfeit locus 1 family protein
MIMPAVTFKLKRIQFELRPGFALLVLTVSALMLWAGFWQLDRAAQKIAIEQSRRQVLDQPVLVLQQVLEFLPEPASIRYRTVQLSGRYASARQFLLDNRIINIKQGAQVGYHVITPLVLNDNRGVVLVDRGWVAAGPQRGVLPDIEIDSTSRMITGTLTIPERGFHLGDMDTDGGGWPRLIQFIDYDALSERLGLAVYPAVIVLDENEPDSYVYDWRPVVDGPQKHYAYAAQWFLMCLAVLILFAYFSVKRHEE